MMDFVWDLDDSSSEEEDEIIEELALAVLSGVRVLESSRKRVRLTRENLLTPNGSPWSRLFQSRHLNGFEQAIRFDLVSFDVLLSFFRPRFDVVYLEIIGRKRQSNRGRPRRLDAAACLGLVLLYMASRAHEYELELIFGITEGRFSTYLNHGISVLLCVLRQDIPAAAIRWPTHEEMAEWSARVHERQQLIRGCFGFIDGVTLPILEPASDYLEQNRYYSSYKSICCVNNVFGFSPEGTIWFAEINAPGSWHDSRVAHRFYGFMRSRTPPGFCVLADQGFASGPKVLTPNSTSLTPFERLSTEQNAPTAVSSARKYRHAHKQGEELEAFLPPPSEVDPDLVRKAILSVRQSAEWGMRSVQGPFQRLVVPLPREADRRALIIETVVRLTNFRARHMAPRVGGNQLQTVYSPGYEECVTSGGLKYTELFSRKFLATAETRKR
eukprot:Opistho-2@13386